MEIIKTTKVGPNYIIKDNLNITEKEYKLFCDYVNINRFGKIDNITEEDILKGRLTFLEIQHNELVREEEFIKKNGYSYKPNCSNFGHYYDNWEWYYICQPFIRVDDESKNSVFEKFKDIFKEFSNYYRDNPREKFMSFIISNEL